jgi:signal transduction histidine kinase
MGSCRRRFVVLGVMVVVSMTPPTRGAAPVVEPVPIASLRRPGPLADVGPDALVVIRGRVAWCVDTEEDGSYAVVQDDTAGIWINVRLARTRGLWNPAADPAVEADWRALEPGMEVAVTGRRDTSGYAPMILPTAIRIADRDAPRVMPEAMSTTAIRLFAGADDSQRVAFSGVLQGYRRQGDAWVLAMGSEGRRFLAHVPADFMPDGPGPFVDGVVRITGVATSKFTTRGEIMAPFLRVARRDDVELVEPPPASTDPARVVPLDRLVGFNPNGPDEHRIRTQGVVTHALPGRMLFVQHGASGVRVETTSPDRFLPGDVVEIVGFVDTSRVLAGIAQAASIREAVVRRIGHEAPPSPIPVQPDEIIETNARAAALGLTAIPGDYDGALVTFTARLSELHRAERGGVLLLSTGKTLLGGLASSVDYAVLSKLEVGSQLRVSGVLQLQLGSDELENLEWGVPEVGRMSVVLRSMDDVKVLEQPPWWTRRRLVNALAAVAVALGAVLAWAALLRRQVAVQSRTLAVEISDRHAAAVEYAATLRERNRLAANLHDTLLQSLSAIGLQLQSCELADREGAASREQQLGLARRMVDHAVGELRGSVWSLRTFPLKGKSFGEAVEALAGQLATAAGIRVTVDRAPDMPAIPDSVAGNLLLVLQEAMHNAARHARSQQIVVSIRRGSSDDHLDVAVADDGQGFDEHAAVGPAEGHFGLHVMRERVERLGGWLELTSRPGHGTTVCAHVRLLRSRNGVRDPSPSPQESAI